jgi:hypothetical protein
LLAATLITNLDLLGSLLSIGHPPMIRAANLLR